MNVIICSALLTFVAAQFLLHTEFQVHRLLSLAMQCWYCWSQTDTVKEHRERGKGEGFFCALFLFDYLWVMITGKYSFSRRKERSHTETPLQEDTTNVLKDLENNTEEEVTVAGSSMHLSYVAQLPREGVKAYRPERLEALYQRLW